MKMSFSQEMVIIALGLHSFRGTVGGSKLTKQTLLPKNEQVLINPNQSKKSR